MNSNPAQEAQVAEETADGYVEDVIAFRRIRAVLAKVDPTAVDRVLGFVVQAETAERTKHHREELSKLRAALPNGLVGQGDAYPA